MGAWPWKSSVSSSISVFGDLRWWEMESAVNPWASRDVWPPFVSANSFELFLQADKTLDVIMEMMSSLAVGKHSVKFQCQNKWIALKDELPHNYTTGAIRGPVFIMVIYGWNSSFPTSELTGVSFVKLATVSNELATGQNLLKDFERASSKVTGGTVDGRNPAPVTVRISA